MIVDLPGGIRGKLIAAVIHNFLFFHIILHSADDVRRYDSPVLPAFIRRLPLLIGKRIARDPGICADGLIADGVGQ